MHWRGKEAWGHKVSAPPRDPKTVHGIQHKTSYPKRLREALNSKRNQLKKMRYQWESGEYVSGHTWTALQYEIEELAKKADAAGWAAGVPFTEGVRQLEPQAGTNNLVDIALTLYKKYLAEQ